MNSFKYPPITIGTWALGDKYWGDQSHSNSLKTIHAALRNGFNSFDTAPVYGKGKSEQLLGQQLPQNSYISTKCFTKSVPQVKKSFELSLKRLSRDFVDTFFIHWPSSKEDYAPVIEYLEEERKAGRIKNIGLSNFTIDMIERSARYGKIDIVQNPFNLFWTRDMPLFNFCKSREIITQGYSPLAQGLLTGKFSKDNPYKPGDMRNHMVLFYPENLKILYPYIEELSKLAENEGITPTRMVLNWSLTKLDSIVVGCRKRSQIEELINLSNTLISRVTISKLDHIAEEVDRAIREYKNIFNHQY